MLSLMPRHLTVELLNNHAVELLMKPPWEVTTTGCFSLRGCTALQSLERNDFTRDLNCSPVSPPSGPHSFSLPLSFAFADAEMSISAGWPSNSPKHRSLASCQISTDSTLGLAATIASPVLRALCKSEEATRSSLVLASSFATCLTCSSPTLDSGVSR